MSTIPMTDETNPALARPVWTDRPGEHWPSMGVAARAVERSRSAVVKALATGRRSAGRRWYSEPPDWARGDERQAIEAERCRAAAIRCHPGRFGSVHNGTDVRTGTVYVGGKAVSGKAPAAA